MGAQQEKHMENTITVDGKVYDVNMLPPSAVRAVQLFARAQNDHAQKAMDLEIATLAVTALSAQMRGALLGVPEYVAPAPAPAPVPADETEAKEE